MNNPRRPIFSEIKNIVVALIADDLPLALLLVVGQEEVLFLGVVELEGPVPVPVTHTAAVSATALQWGMSGLIETKKLIFF